MQVAGRLAVGSISVAVLAKGPTPFSVALETATTTRISKKREVSQTTRFEVSITAFTADAETESPTVLETIAVGKTSCPRMAGAFITVSFGGQKPQAATTTILV